MIGEIEKRTVFPDPDRILFRAYLQKGVLLDVKENYEAAKQAYCKALSLPASTDSLSFVANVYAGTAYYNLNNFDSASYLLLRAESGSAWHGSADEGSGSIIPWASFIMTMATIGRAKNYFNRALEIVQSKKNLDTLSAVYLETNIATSFSRLDLYRESLALYKKIINYRLVTNYIYINMGRTYAALDKYRASKGLFRKVNVVRLPAVLNEMAASSFAIGSVTIRAAYFLDRLRYRGDARH